MGTDIVPQLAYPVLQFLRAFRPAQAAQPFALNEDEPVVEYVDSQVGEEGSAAS